MSPIGERADPREGRVTRGKRLFESRGPSHDCLSGHRYGHGSAVRSY